MASLIDSRSPVTVDAAGGTIGGAARWHGELSSYLAANAIAGSVRIIGRGHRLTPTWLVRRELLASNSTLVIAPNNASFAASGGHRVVLAVNALHYLHAAEEHLLKGFSRSWCTQIPVVRRLLKRADTVLVPCAEMADRVAHHVPAVARRIVVRPHPVTPSGPRRVGDARFILVPVVPSPHKNLMSQLRLLIGALDLAGRAAEIRVTARSDQLPPDINGHPRIVPVGTMPFEALAELWRTAWAVYFPSEVEAFGFPLAEARAYGVPVLAPSSQRAVEIAGPALRAYDPRSPHSLIAALLAADEPTRPDPDPFDRDSYFRSLFGEPDPTNSQRGAYGLV